MGDPILPRDLESPLGESRIAAGAVRRTNEAVTGAFAVLISAVREVGTVEQAVADGLFIEWQLTPVQLDELIDQLEAALADDVGEHVTEYATKGYEKGTADAVANLTAIAAADYLRDVDQVLLSQAYQRRIAFLLSSIPDATSGMASDSAGKVKRRLVEAIAAGENPRSVAADLREIRDVTKSQADRIARTEITGALRAARWDEEDAAARDYGIKTKLLHLSALSPTTRVGHAERHGKAYTSDEVRAWYNTGGNRFNCRCSQVSVLVDDDGVVLQEGTVAKAKKMRDDWEAKEAEREK